jgi:uncharacterized protein (TIGR02996 family)
MSEGDALLRAVLANPADDAPRLVYADWLTEHDQGDRADEIRGQVANPGFRLWGGCPEYQNGSWGDLTGVVRFRGFVGEWRCWARDFEQYAVVMFSTYPIEVVQFADRKPLRFTPDAGSSSFDQPDRFAWGRQGRQSDNGRHWIRDDLWALIEGGETARERYKRFDSAEAAVAALAVALVEYGRRKSRGRM